MRREEEPCTSTLPSSSSRAGHGHGHGHVMWELAQGEGLWAAGKGSLSARTRVGL